MLRFNVFPTSRTTAIADIEEKSNTGSRGQYMYRIDSAVIQQVTTAISECDELPSTYMTCSDCIIYHEHK